MTCIEAASRIVNAFELHNDAEEEKNGDFTSMVVFKDEKLVMADASVLSNPNAIDLFTLA
jgi:phosphotransacetylase